MYNKMQKDSLEDMMTKVPSRFMCLLSRFIGLGVGGEVDVD